MSVPKKLLTSSYFTPMAPNQSPKKRGGRPRKHITKEAAIEAARESKLRWYHQSR
jgi:hypothetical protein